MGNLRRGSKCCANNCNSFSRTHRDLTSNKIGFYKFPNDVCLRNEWIARVQLSYDNQNIQFHPKSRSMVCGLHFNANGKKSYDDKVPVIIMDHHLARTVFISNIVRLDEDPHGMLLNIAADVTVGIEPVEVDPPSKIAVSACPASDNLVHLEHTYCIPVSKEVQLLNRMDLMRKNEKTLTEELKQLRKSVTFFETENNQLKREIIRLQEAVKNKEEENQKQTFTLENVSLKKGFLKFYTGFSCVEDFNVLYHQIEPELSTISLYNNGKGYERSADRNESSRGRSMALRFREQLFLTLCKLRVGLLNKDLAYRFNISHTTVSNYITTWLDLLYRKLTIIPILPSKDIVNKYMPQEFKEKFPTTRVIIDCTEFFIERPSDNGTQCDTYSNYKRHTTAKGLIGATPNGFVSFVAPLAPGRESDTELTTNSGLVELLENGDSVMGDRGFLIHDILAAKGVELNMPPFLGDKKQLSAIEEQRTRDIASVRIHIERVIKELKNFRILKYTFPILWLQVWTKSGLYVVIC